MQPAGRPAVRILLTADQNWIAAYRWCMCMVAPPGGGDEFGMSRRGSQWAPFHSFISFLCFGLSILRPRRRLPSLVSVFYRSYLVEGFFLPRFAVSPAVLCCAMSHSPYKENCRCLPSHSAYTNTILLYSTRSVSTHGVSDCLVEINLPTLPLPYSRLESRRVNQSRSMVIRSSLPAYLSNILFDLCNTECAHGKFRPY